jgi:hypothetical protein
MTQFPVPLVILMSDAPPVLLHASLAANVTAPVPLPPDVATEKLVPKTALAGAPVTVSVACAAFCSVTVTVGDSAGPL